MSPTRLAIRRPVTTLMLFLSLMLMGVISTRLLPLEFLPDLAFPGLLVQVPYPGSSPEEVERLITRPLEEALATLGGIQRMNSTSNRDEAVIILFFPWNSDMIARAVEVRDRIDGARGQLPTDVERVTVRKFTTSDDPILGLRIGSEQDLSAAWELLERNVRRRLERLDGVARVSLDGVSAREVRILLHADRVAAHRIDLVDLRERLRRANFSVSGGLITDHDAGLRLRIAPQGELRSLEELRELPISAAGLRLADIADVVLAEPPQRYGRLLDGNFAVGIDVFAESGANLVEVSRAVMAEVAAINELPEMAGIDLYVLFSQADGVTSSLRDLAMAGLLGALLSLLVLFAFLRHVATTLVVMLSVPAAVLITLGAMYFLGLSLNILTMMGLMLAIGMLVDNGVVVTESIHRQRERHPDAPGKATLLGTRDVALAISAGTLTTIIVFLPNIFGAQNEVTVFLSHVAYTITIALLVSLLLAQTVLPLLTLRLGPPPRVAEAGLLPRLTRGYARLLTAALRRRWTTAAVVMILLLSVIVPMGMVPANMFADAESDRLMLRYHVNSDYSLDKVREAVDEIEAWLVDHQAQLAFDSLYSFYTYNRAETTLVLNPDRRISNEAIRAFVRDNLPPIAIGRPGFDVQRGGSGESLTLWLHGESTGTLLELSGDLSRLLATVQGLSDVRSAATTGTRELNLSVDRERALRHGMSPAEVAESVALALRGEVLNEFRGPEGDLRMHLSFHGADLLAPAQLAALPLVNPRGERVPLSALAELAETDGPTGIQRENRRTSLPIHAALNGVSVSEARDAIDALMAQVQLPAGYDWSYGRAFQQDAEAMNQMLFNMLLAVALIFIVMAALFESTLFPVSIITSILFSFVGVWWFFLLTGTELSLMALIGMLVLMGIVVNNGIVLIDHANNLRRRGMGRDDAVIQAGKDRLRPILMTAATTILAMVPLAAGDTQMGGGGPPYYPMARAIIGGLAFSTLVSLIVVPFVYVLLDSLREWTREVMARAAVSAVP